LRAELSEFNQFDIAEIGKLHFYKPDEEKFKSLKILKSILDSIDSNSSLIFNIANEVAVEHFLNDKISFNQITEVIEEMLNKIEYKELHDLESVKFYVELVRNESLAYINALRI
jgi:1-deoxy-D-xylulose-5-phosphate reductoisomerase